MRGRTNINGSGNMEINGDIKLFSVANGEVISPGDFVQYKSETVEYGFGSETSYVNRIFSEKIGENKLLILYSLASNKSVYYLSIVDITQGFRQINTIIYAADGIRSWYYKNGQVLILSRDTLYIYTISNDNLSLLTSVVVDGYNVVKIEDKIYILNAYKESGAERLDKLKWDISIYTNSGEEIEFERKVEAQISKNENVYNIQNLVGVSHYCEEGYLLFAIMAHDDYGSTSQPIYKGCVVSVKFDIQNDLFALHITKSSDGYKTWLSTCYFNDYKKIACFGQYSENLRKVYDLLVYTYSNGTAFEIYSDIDIISNFFDAKDYWICGMENDLFLIGKTNQNTDGKYRIGMLQFSESFSTTLSKKDVETSATQFFAGCDAIKKDNSDTFIIILSNRAVFFTLDGEGGFYLGSETELPIVEKYKNRIMGVSKTGGSGGDRIQVYVPKTQGGDA